MAVLPNVDRKDLWAEFMRQSNKNEDKAVDDNEDL